LRVLQISLPIWQFFFAFQRYVFQEISKGVIHHTKKKKKTTALSQACEQTGKRKIDLTTQAGV